MQKKLVGYARREELKILEGGEGSSVTVFDRAVLRFTAFSMQLASGELVPVEVTFDEKEEKKETTKREGSGPQSVTVESSGSPGEAHWRSHLG